MARTSYPTYRILSDNFKKLQLRPPPHTVSTQCTNCIFTYHLLIPPILRLVQDVHTISSHYLPTSPLCEYLAVCVCMLANELLLTGLVNL